MNDRGARSTGTLTTTGPFADVDDSVGVDRQIVRGHDEPIRRGLQPIELLERVQADALDLQGRREGLDAMPERIAPQPGLHPQGVGVLLASFRTPP